MVQFAEGAWLGAATRRLPWGGGGGGGGGGLPGPCPAPAAPAAFLWHCALKKICRVVSRQHYSF